jgi:hypothetical protein
MRLTEIEERTVTAELSAEDCSILALACEHAMLSNTVGQAHMCHTGQDCAQGRTGCDKGGITITGWVRRSPVRGS